MGKMNWKLGLLGMACYLFGVMSVYLLDDSIAMKSMDSLMASAVCMPKDLDFYVMRNGTLYQRMDGGFCPINGALIGKCLIPREAYNDSQYEIDYGYPKAKAPKP